MHRFDLIPPAFHRLRSRRRWLVRGGALCAAVVTASLLGGYLLGHWNTALRADVARQAQTRDAWAQVQSQITLVSERHQRLRQRADGLAQLRRGLSMNDTLAVIERQLGNGDIWFLSWQAVQAAPPRTAAPAAEASLLVSMSIRGRAGDHAALSAFVRRLAAHPAIRDVRIENTNAERVGDAPVVSFSLAVMLDGSAVVS